MNKSFGFTLAEVLITLGIIGVVAALTAPALVKNTGTSKIGPSLAKFVNTFETACEQMMYEENINKISSISGSGDYKSKRDKIMETLSKYMYLTELTDYCQVNEPDGSMNMSSENEAVKVYQLKDGSIIYVFGRALSYEIDISNSPYKGPVLDIRYDINGPKGNNKMAKEVFMFMLDDSGILVPSGSSLFGSNIACDPNKSDAQSAWACTAHVIQNGYKADY